MALFDRLVLLGGGLERPDVIVGLRCDIRNATGRHHPPGAIPIAKPRAESGRTRE